MLNGKGVRVAYYTVKESNTLLPYGKIFMIIARSGENEVKSGKHLYYGCQLTSSKSQARYSMNLEIIEENSQSKYYIKGDQLYDLNIDLDELNLNPYIDINFNIRFSDKVFEEVEKKLNEANNKGKLKYYDSVEDVLILIKKNPNQKYILEEESE